MLLMLAMGQATEQAGMAVPLQTGSELPLKDDAGAK